MRLILIILIIINFVLATFIIIGEDDHDSIINNLDYKKTVRGGDHLASKMYLLNIKQLFSSDVIKAFSEKGKTNEKIIA